MFFQNLSLPNQNLKGLIKKKSFVLLLILLVVFLSVPLLGLSEQNDFAEAVNLMSDKKWAQAEKKLLRLKQDRPNDIAVLNNLGITYFHLKKLSDARKFFIKSIESNPQTKAAFRNLLQLNSVQQSNKKPYFKKLDKMQTKSAPPTQASVPLKQQAINTKAIAQQPKQTKRIKKKKSQPIASPPKDDFKIAAEQLKRQPVMSIDDLGKEDDLITQINKEELSNSFLDDIDKEINMEIDFDTPTTLNEAEASNSYLEDIFTDDVIVLDEKIPTPSIAEPVNSEVKKIINERLNSWKVAWSAGDVKKYFDFYSANYSPDNQSRTTWMKNRRSRISPQREIELKITDIKVSHRFQQVDDYGYRSCV